MSLVKEREMTVHTSPAHVFAVAARFDLLLTMRMQGDEIRTEREIPGGVLVYRARLKEKVCA